jgi:hypothetical protein
MNTLIIKDLSVNEDMNGKAMSAVRGGFYSGWKLPMLVAEAPRSSSTTTVSLSQSNTQFQNNPTGNNSAVFGGDIYAANNQQAFNVVGAGPLPMREALRF